MCDLGSHVTTDVDWRRRALEFSGMTLPNTLRRKSIAIAHEDDYAEDPGGLHHPCANPDKGKHQSNHCIVMPIGNDNLHNYILAMKMDAIIGSLTGRLPCPYTASSKLSIYLSISRSVQCQMRLLRFQYIYRIWNT